MGARQALKLNTPLRRSVKNNQESGGSRSIISLLLV